MATFQIQAVMINEPATGRGDLKMETLQRTSWIQNQAKFQDFSRTFIDPPNFWCLTGLEN
jgi:hypothetical protein